MDREIRSSFVFLLILLWPIHCASTPTKCCPLQYELSSPDIVSQIVSRTNMTCVKSVDSLLTVSHPFNLTTGLPNCSHFRFVDVYDKLTQVDCVDRVTQKNEIFGIRCENKSGLHQQQRIRIPPIVNFRKCCPSNRRYDADKQFCWNHLAKNHTNALTDALKLSIKGKNVFVNVTYGLPHCRPTDVLFDRLEYYQKILITKSDGMYDSNGLLSSSEEYCLDVVDDLWEYLVIRSCRDRHVACNSTGTSCVRKCCPFGYEVKVRGCQPSTKALSFAFHNGTVALANVRPAVLQGDKCKGGKYLEDEVKYVLTVDGQVHIPSRNKVIGMDEYCFDTVNEKEGTNLFICFAEEWQHPQVKFEFRLTLNMICAGISVLFLLITFIIYAILPSLKNAHCRLIMCYLFTSMAGYTVVVIQGLLPHILDISPTLCKIVGFTMMFTFLSSFSWLNIISFDIWSTFRAVQSSFFKKSRTSKRFLCFCVYGWGFAAGWTAIAVFCQSTSVDMPPILKPDIGDVSCWFSSSGTSRIVFFIIPFSAMITFNILLFIVTVKYCAHIKSELQMSHSHNSNYSIKKYTADMNEFMINIKLFILMGLNWTMELISLTVKPEDRIFFVASDILNALEGVIIFCLFVLKRKVLRDLKKTFCGGYPEQRPRNRATTLTTSTTSSVIQSMINSKSSSTVP